MAKQKVITMDIAKRMEEIQAEIQQEAIEVEKAKRDLETKAKAKKAKLSELKKIENSFLVDINCSNVSIEFRDEFRKHIDLSNENREIKLKANDILKDAINVFNDYDSLISEVVSRIPTKKSTSSVDNEKIKALEIENKKLLETIKEQEDVIQALQSEDVKNDKMKEDDRFAG